MADEDRKPKRLQVATMRPEDSGRGIAVALRANSSRARKASKTMVTDPSSRTFPSGGADERSSP